MDITLLQKAERGFHAAKNKKASDVVTLDIRGVSSAADFFMICSGESTRQVQAIADEVIAKLKEVGVRPAGIEGYDAAKWILLDYYDIVVHIFHLDTRKYYEIERLWEDVPIVEFNDAKISEDS